MTTAKARQSLEARFRQTLGATQSSELSMMPLQSRRLQSLLLDHQFRWAAMTSTSRRVSRQQQRPNGLLRTATDAISGCATEGWRPIACCHPKSRDRENRAKTQEDKEPSWSTNRSEAGIFWIEDTLSIPRGRRRPIQMQISVRNQNRINGIGNPGNARWSNTHLELTKNFRSRLRIRQRR